MKFRRGRLLKSNSRPGLITEASRELTTFDSYRTTRSTSARLESSALPVGLMLSAESSSTR